jgi:hypothetical protein
MVSDEDGDGLAFPPVASQTATDHRLRTASTRAMRAACSGWRREANRNSE